MRKLEKLGVCTVVLTLSVAGAALADSKVRGRLSGFQEVPVIVSGGAGKFDAKIDRDAGEIRWEMSYRGTTGNVTQAHIHVANRGSNGGVAVFLCTNLGNFPTQACPAAPGTVSGTIRAADILGPASQGIAAGDFDSLVKAIKAGATYINVHTDAFPPGELRAQVGKRRGKESKDSKR